MRDFLAALRSSLRQSEESEPEDLLMRDFQAVESRGGLRCYAPRVFRHFRALLGISATAILASLSSCITRASGELYVTEDDRVQLQVLSQRKAALLVKLLPAYYVNLTQNPASLLPSFLGLYFYRGVRMALLHNLVPTSVQHKYLLTGSGSGLQEDAFVGAYPQGLALEAGAHAVLLRTLERDCRVLESSRLTDYALLLGVHRVAGGGPHPPGGIPVRDAASSRDRLLLFLGLVDVLRGYRLRDRLHLGGGGSTPTHPALYSKRLQSFAATRVFRRLGDVGGRLQGDSDSEQDN